jgi:hypothetical protein
MVDTPGASFEAVQLLVGEGLRKRVRAFTASGAAIIMVGGVVFSVFLWYFLHFNNLWLFVWLVCFPMSVLLAMLAAGLRRFNAFRLRRRGAPARLVFTPEGLSVRSAEAPLDRPWPQIPMLYLQPQGATCTMPAFDAEKRRVLFISASAQGIRDAIEFHSGGRTHAKIFMGGQLSNSLRNIAEGVKYMSR